MQTNRHVVLPLLLQAGIAEASGLSFELPSGSKVIVRREDDVFLERPYQPGTKIGILISARARASVKMDGDHWRVHQNDPDDNWPSDFHAHNLTHHRETLNCYTGEIFDPTTRQFKRKYSGKQLRCLLNKLPERVKPKAIEVSRIPNSGHVSKITQ